MCAKSENIEPRGKEPSWRKNPATLSRDIQHRKWPGGSKKVGLKVRDWQLLREKRYAKLEVENSKVEGAEKQKHGERGLRRRQKNKYTNQFRQHRLGRSTILLSFAVRKRSR